MKENKINRFLLITSILSTLILIIGSTFSYFSISARSEADALAVEAGKIKLGLGVSQRFTPKKLIPTNDDDIMIAYNSKCTDIYNFGACLAFDLEVSNFADAQSIVGSINFTVENIENLSYMVLDESDGVILPKTKVISGENQTMGDSFTIASGTEMAPATKKLTLLVWLTNLDMPQEDYDAGGSFSAIVTYNSVDGNVLTGTIKGKRLETNATSKLGEGDF